VERRVEDTSVVGHFVGPSVVVRVLNKIMPCGLPSLEKLMISQF